MTEPAGASPLFERFDVNRFRVNGRLTGARNSTSLALIGAPRGTFDDQCRDPQNPALLALLETADLGPFRATGLRPALATLATILREIESEAPGCLERLGCETMLCCRMVRGSHEAISNHSWGIAIDLTIDGISDPLAVPGGLPLLLRIHPVFRRHGFFWGAAFPVAEPAHFEASDQLLRRWAAEGAFGPDRLRAPSPGLTVGDRGPEVLTLQQALNAHLPFPIREDGVFGAGTRAAVTDLQTRHAIRPDGIAGPGLLKVLDLRQI